MRLRYALHLKRRKKGGYEGACGLLKKTTSDEGDAGNLRCGLIQGEKKKKGTKGFRTRPAESAKNVGPPHDQQEKEATTQ